MMAPKRDKQGDIVQTAKRGKMKSRPYHPSRLFFRQLRRPELSRSEKRNIEALARRLEAESAFARERLYFEPFARRGLGDGHLTIIGDVREIPLLAEHSSSALEYRLSTFARTGDLVVIGTGRNRDFEDYREQVLQLGSADYLETRQPTVENLFTTPFRCLKDTDTYADLLQRVRSHGSTTVLPHITTGTIWALARKLGEDSGQPVPVAGPLPTLSRLANNKLWFSKVAGALLGPEAVPVEIPVHGAASLTGRVRSLAKHNNNLVIKVPDSAGSAGNFVISCAEVRALSVGGTHTFLSELLAPVDGDLHFPLMVQVWENQVLTSPSAQIWIPDPKDGPPIIEGLYEQVISGPTGTFAGALQADLPPELDERMAHEALMLATVFQELGYFGRCSFDTVISGEDFASARLLWIECNGRWGGVSVPMTFLNTLFRDAIIPEFVIHHAPGATHLRQHFSEGIAKVGDLLWTPGGTEGIMFLTPSGFETGENLHFVSLAATIERARDNAELAVRRLAEGA
jgi:hypothetical protein